MKKNIDIVVQKPKGLFIGLDVRILWAHQWSSSEYHRRVIQTHKSPHHAIGTLYRSRREE